MSVTTQQLQSLSESGKVYAGDDKVGSIGQVYLDDKTGEPTWVTVKTGLFGTAETFVPLSGAEVRGDDLAVAFDEATIKGAPRIDADGSIEPHEEDELYRYYGLDGATGSAEHDGTGQTTASEGHGTVDSVGLGSGVDDASYGTGDPALADVPVDTDERVGDDVVADRDIDRGVVGHDTSGPTTDDAMTRSEERVNVGTRSRESGRARLRKYVTTDTVTETVPVRHEEVTIEREPITAENAVAAGAGPEISEKEHEVVLHEEVPVVEKEVVGVERIKLGTETITDDVSVSEDVRKENVELVDPDQDAHADVDSDADHDMVRPDPTR